MAFQKFFPLTPASSDFLSLLNYFHYLTNSNCCHLKTKLKKKKNFILIPFQIIPPFSAFLFSKVLKMLSKFHAPNSSSCIPFWVLSSEVLDPTTQPRLLLSRSLRMRNPISHPHQQHSVISSQILYFFIGLPGFSLFSSYLFSLLCWFFLISLTWEHWSCQGSQQDLFFALSHSLPSLLLSFSPTALNTVWVLTTLRSLAGLLSSSYLIYPIVHQHLHLDVSNSAYTKQNFDFPLRTLLSNCSLESLLN